eukprot:Nitzschia sp. Nitz4//scaffold82_size85912//69800//73896//NITZ4_005150-RA/size85912-processed-gene-0.126-mRNA-1//-1//CDS//3329558862//3179//frame0
MSGHVVLRHGFLSLGKLLLLVGFLLHSVVGAQGFCLVGSTLLLPPPSTTTSTTIPTTTTALHSSNASSDYTPSVTTTDNTSNQSSWQTNPVTLLPRILQHYKTEYQLRMAADPSFLQKSILEVMVAASAQLAAEWNRRGWDRLLPEIEWVLPAVLTAVFGKYYSMWRVAPTTMVNRTKDTDKTKNHRNDILFWSMPVPTNAFQPYLMDGITRPTLIQRLASILAPMKSLFQAGFGSSFVGYGVGALLLRARALWCRWMMPPEDVLCGAAARVTQPVNILHASIFTGFFLMIDPTRAAFVRLPACIGDTKLPVKSKDGSSEIRSETDKKKKKRNRKKKKSGDANNSNSNNNSTTNNSSGAASNSGSATLSQQEEELLRQQDKMNPHARLRHRLFTEASYSLEEIDQAMEEMWNKNLAYDDFDSVCLYLCEGDPTPVSSEPIMQETSRPPPTQASYEPWKGHDVVTTTSNNHRSRGGGGVEESKEAPPDELASKPAAQTTMEGRLEMVVSFDNLTDAIFAVTEWVSKAAKPQDLHNVCATTHTDALVTIFQRSLTECDDPSEFDASIVPAMVRLMQCLLDKSELKGSSQLQKTQQAFERLFRQARTVVAGSSQDADLALRVSRFLVSRVALALGDAPPSSSSKTAPKNGAGMVGNPNQVMDLLSQREVQKAALQLSAARTRSVCTSLPGASYKKAPPTPKVDASSILIALVGEDTMGALKSQENTLQKFKANVEDEETEALEELQTTMEELTQERESIQQRILELRQSIERLEAYDAELCVKLDDTRMELEAATQRASAESVSLGMEIYQTQEAAERGAMVGGLADLLNKYNHSLQQAMVNSISTSSTSSSVEKVSQEMETCLTRARHYFETEATAVKYLRERVAVTDKEVLDLQREILECEGLGMDATIGQMRASMATKVTERTKNMGLLERFTADAKQVRESLADQLMDYSAARQKTSSLRPLTEASIGFIPSHLETLGLPPINWKP